MLNAHPRGREAAGFAFNSLCDYMREGSSTSYRSKSINLPHLRLNKRRNIMSTPARQYPKLLANIAAINAIYSVPPQVFAVGDQENRSGESKGSLAILGFARANGLSNIFEILPMFGEAYDEVLADPNGTSHANIRALTKHGMDGVVLEQGVELRPELKLIRDAFPHRAEFKPDSHPKDVREAVEFVISELDCGRMRVAMKLGYRWWTNQAVKEAILLSFRLRDNRVMNGGDMQYFDKVEPKFSGALPADYFTNAGIRVVPPAVARKGAYIAKNVVLMPSYVNIGAYVDEGTMVDTWATVGSCAQIGKNVHLSGGVGIGGVIEPVQANPTIIEDNCFIGARSEIVEGVIVEEGSVISMGVFIGQSTKILDRETGEISYGRIPAGSVVVSGNLPAKDGSHSLYCAVIVKKVDAQTRGKVGINELLRGI